MNLGYARVSTPDQKLDLQLDALTAAGCERIFTDVVTSTRMERPGLREADSHLRANDCLIIWRFDRLARSTKHLITLAEDYEARGIALRSLQNHIDTTTAQGKFFFTVMAACAQLERELLVERTRAGLAAARARGRKGGRKAKLSAEDKAMVRAVMGHASPNVSALAKRLGVHRATIYRALEEAPPQDRAAAD
jgi:DNA invertase Pin-like site-specific DNA recombinase